MKRTFLTLLAALLLVPSLALAEDSDETPRTMALELRLGPYTPGIDSEFTGDKKPYDTVFGDNSAWLYGAEFDIQLWQGFGSFGLFGSGGWGFVKGKGIAEGDFDSTDETTLSLAPLVFGGVYRFDVLAQRWNIPFVLSAKLGFDYTLWWVRDGVEEVASYEKEENGTELPGYGGTMGLHWALGLHLLLDFFEPHTAKIFDNDMGVNNSYLFVEYVGYWVNDFGSSSSFDLSHNGVAFGLAFEL